MLWKSGDARTEASIGFLLDANNRVTDTVVFEVLTPVYPTHSREYDGLMNKLQAMRDRIYGWKPVVDLSSVPLEVGVQMPLVTGMWSNVPCVNLFIIYEEIAHRNRYVYVGKPKAEFRIGDVHWVDQLQIAGAV